MESLKKLDDRLSAQNPVARLMCLAFFGCLFVLPTKASSPPNPGLVEVRNNDAVFESYRERRSLNGLIFGISYENYRPKNFLSSIDSESYSSTFGSTPVTLGQFEVGYKLNFGPASIAASFEYGQGQVNGSELAGEERRLSIEKTALKATLFIDGIFEEPYVVPYAGISLWKFGIDEKIVRTDVSFSGKTQPGTSVDVGLLLQLNWIEPETARWALVRGGVENTYIDLFLRQYAKSSGSADPDTSSDMNWGVGLKVEF